MVYYELHHLEQSKKYFSLEIIVLGMFWCWGSLKDGFFKVFVKIIVLKTKKKTKESFLKTVGKIHGNIFLGNFVKARRSIFVCVCLLMSRLKQGYFFVLRYIRTSLRGVFWKKTFVKISKIFLYVWSLFVNALQNITKFTHHDFL